MCGRFSLYADSQMLATLLECTALAGFYIEKRYNIAPNQWILIVRPSKNSGNEPLLAKWGLVPSWAKNAESGPKPINARAEGLSDKPAFRGALRYGRCLIPASGFFEWKINGKTKTPYFIRPKGGGIFLFAGLSDNWVGSESELRTCAIITTSANKLMIKLHDRQPVILDKKGAAEWLDPSTKPDDVLYPCPEEWMEKWEVGPQVGSASNEGPELILPK